MHEFVGSCGFLCVFVCVFCDFSGVWMCGCEGVRFFTCTGVRVCVYVYRGGEIFLIYY